MPNLYPYFDNGTWEAYSTNTEYFMIGSTQADSFVKSNEQAYDGIFSGKITMLYVGIPPGGGSSRSYFMLWLRTTSAIGANNVRPITLIQNQTYKISTRVFVPSSNKIASDTTPIAIVPNFNRPLSPGESVQYKLVAECLDHWEEVSWTFTSNVSNQTTFQSLIALALVPADNGVNYTAFAIPKQGAANLGGVMYFDGISVELIPPVCDLQFNTPAYTKTDETAVDANNGTITFFASHTDPLSDSLYTIEYSIDAINWQLSNFFAGVAPGFYSGYVRDNRGGECLRQVDNIQIIEFNPPPPPPPPPPVGELVFDAKPINTRNFVSWFNSLGKINFNSLDCTNCCWDLAQGYRANKISSMRHYVIAVPGVKFTFYINLPEGLSDPNFASFRLALIRNDGYELLDFATLKKDTFEDGVHYNIYADNVIIPTNGPPYQVYRLAIYNQTTNDVLLISNEILLMELDEAKCMTNEIKFRASFDMYGYRYQAVPDYLNIIRLRLYNINEDVDGDLSQYRGASTGRLRNVSFELDEFIVLQSYFFDDLAHRAMRVFQAHDYILINDIAYLVKTFYKVEYNLSRRLNKGTIEMYNQAFSQANRYSSAPIIVIGSEDPLLLGDNGGFIKL